MYKWTRYHITDQYQKYYSVGSEVLKILLRDCVSGVKALCSQEKKLIRYNTGIDQHISYIRH